MAVTRPRPEHPQPTARTVICVSSSSNELGLHWMHLRKTRVFAIFHRHLAALSIEEWAALCDEQPVDVSRLYRDYLTPTRVPLKWTDSFDMFSVPPDESRVIDAIWRPCAPDDALVKRFVLEEAVDWVEERREAEGWLISNANARPVLPGWLYLARRSDGTGPVKLGFSREPDRRVQRLPANYGLPGKYVVIAKVHGTPHDEDILGRALAKHQIKRHYGSAEWFQPLPAVLSALERLLPRVRRLHPEPKHREALHPAKAFIEGFDPAVHPKRQLHVSPMRPAES